jgi:glycosyltransferase involved in cell wall biosynthesis
VDAVSHGINGLLTSPNNPVALAEALQQMLLSETLLRRLTDGAMETAAQAFNWVNISATLVRTYCELRAVDRGDL